VYEKRLQQTPTLILIDNTPKIPLHYNEQNVATKHVEEVSKCVGEKVRTQILVEIFTGQATRWWETHSQRLKTWTTMSTYFIECFGENKLAKKIDIRLFKMGYDPMEKIHHCEN
jgi:hypothetical protein